MKHQRKGNRLLVALAATGVLVALLVGMLVGMATSDVFGQYMPWNRPDVEAVETVPPTPDATDDAPAWTPDVAAIGTPAVAPDGGVDPAGTEGGVTG